MRNLPAEWRVGVGAGAGPAQIIYIKSGATSYAANPNPAGAILLVYSLALSGSPTYATLTGGGTITSPPNTSPIEVTLDGTPGTLVVSGHFLTTSTITIPGAKNLNVNDFCVTHPEACAVKTKACSPLQVVDTVTGACVAPCSDGSAPSGGQCGTRAGGTAHPPAAPASAATSTAAYVVGGLGILVAGAAAWYALK